MNNIQEIKPICQTDIAVIGMAGRFPQADNLDSHWHNIKHGVEAITRFNEADLQGVDTKLLHHPNYVKSGFILENIDLFAASFFDYSPREAEIMDPQQRIFLEVAWEALENAGYDAESYPGVISIYASSSVNGYFLFNIFPNPELIKLIGLDQIRHNNRAHNLATRVAYKLNLKGSAIHVQTGCSSSLVGIHLACQSLLNCECDIALAGGVSISGTQKTGYLYQEGGILSPDGHCRAFDAQAKGTVNGNGVGIVILKRLQDAITQGDRIHAIIKGTAVNNDGSVKVGYTAPSIDGQAKVIAEALTVSGVNPETVSYVETHGTGTVLGDPIEVAALSKSFSHYTQSKNFCALGTVKTNIGHLDAAAGVAGFIKTVLALRNKEIPPHSNFTSPNPQIDFVNSPFYINNQLKQWHSSEHPRRAGVNSFGIGGTNAHIILEEAPASLKSGNSRQWQILPLSAKTNSALEAATKNLVNYLKQYPNLNLADVAYTLSMGRRHFEYRHIAVCQDKEDAIAVLENLQPSSSPVTEHSSVIFMFTGQGSQYVDMGRELYETEPVFREQVDKCCQLLQPYLGLDLRSIIYPQTSTSQTTQQLTQTAITQPALFVIEYALAKLWMAWGVHPQAMIGHSIGEYVAATIAGVFPLEDALEIVAMRGKLMQQLPSGKMLAVFLSEVEIAPLLNKSVSLAANNAPNLCVVSGTHTAIDELHQQLITRGIECRQLHTSHAFHSQMMSPMIEEFQEFLGRFSLNVPQIPFISNLTGTWIATSQATDSHYWGQHLQQTVRFADGVTELGKQPEQIFLEVGPGKVLTNLVKQQQPSLTILSSLRHPREQQSDVGFLLNTLGQLWQKGIQINWSAFYHSQRRHRLPLPTYPFERQRFWIEPQTQVTTINHNHVSEDINDWFYVPVWKQAILPVKYPTDELIKTQKFCWLVFLDDLGIGIELVQQLQQQGQDVITVQLGEQFAQISDGVYSINSSSKTDYDTLIQHLDSINKKPQKIAHLWGITQKNLDLSSISNRGFWSLLFLTQALAKNSANQEVQIIVVTNNLHNVTGEENICPEKATILGACKVINQEFGHINCRHIDIVIPQQVDKKRELLAQITNELTSDFKEFIISYRGKHRWIQTFEKIQLETENLDKSPLQQSGVYLITGGLGGIGLTLAKYLAQTVQAKLILIGRSLFPHRDDWEQWLKEHDNKDTVSQKIKKIQELETFGAEVLVCNADITSHTQMQTIKEKILTKFGKVNGVIHTAGVPGGGIIQLKTSTAAARVLAPKVQGTLVLDSVFCDNKLDLFVLCSSLESIIGSLGQIDYCAANAFLDGFAQSKSLSQKPLTIAINWCGWQEVGMLVNTAIPEELKSRREQHLNKAISSENGVEVFRRILHSQLPQVAVCKQNLNEQIERSYAVNLVTELNNLEEQSSQIKSAQKLYPRPQLNNPYVAPRTEIEKKIADLWQQLLGLEEIGLDDNFFEMGGNSLLLINVNSQLRKIFSIDLTLMDMFRLPTISNLSKFLASQSQEILLNESQPDIEKIKSSKNQQQERLQKMRKIRNEEK